MFEKEKKQYDEDAQNHELAWELWEYKEIGKGGWRDLSCRPKWLNGSLYRRKQTAFVPEYFSGLNWKDAERLISKTIECTNNPDSGWHVGVLTSISKNNVIAHFDINADGFVDYFVYIRTCEKTFKHPTINIGRIELPKPETVAPEPGTTCYVLRFNYPSNNNLYDRITWPIELSLVDKTPLRVGTLHLTEERAQAWADWWKTTVIDKMK